MKPKLTFEEHVEMGQVLASLRDELQTRHVQLSNAYPQSGPSAAAARKLQRAKLAVEEARTELENALYREHPEQAETAVYYPKR